MARRACIIRTMDRLNIPNVVSKIIGDYGSWEIWLDNREKTDEMFRVNSRRILTFTDATTNESVTFKRDAFNMVQISCNGCIFYQYATMDMFVRMLARGQMLPFGVDQNNMFIESLQKQVIDRWNSL